MKILVAPDSFKGCISADTFCQITRKAWLEANPSDYLVSLPMADGGEGMMEILVSHLKGRKIKTDTVDPLGRFMTANIGLIDDDKTAIIDTASASGMSLLSEEERNPYLTSTFGTGLLVKKALDLEVTKIVIGLGGSVTNDAGAGFLSALGARFLDVNGNLLMAGGFALNHLNTLELASLDPRISSVKWICACDVNNPLLGKDGASQIYGPQKGANAEMVRQLEAALSNFSIKLHMEVGFDVSEHQGAGAAGGLGAAILGVLEGEFRSGIELVMDYCDLNKHLGNTHLVITGEGKLDCQTLAGKVPLGVAKRAQAAGVPVIVIAGAVSGGVDLGGSGINAIFSISSKPQTLSEAISNTPAQLASLVTNIAKITKIFQRA